MYGTHDGRSEHPPFDRSSVRTHVVDSRTTESVVERSDSADGKKQAVGHVGLFAAAAGTTIPCRIDGSRERLSGSNGHG